MTLSTHYLAIIFLTFTMGITVLNLLGFYPGKLWATTIAYMHALFFALLLLSLPSPIIFIGD